VHEHPGTILRGLSRGYWGSKAECADGLPGISRSLPEGPNGGRWYVSDPRNNQPRIGRLLMAYGRDAADVAISTIYGQAFLVRFEVITDEILE
jgi:hypothetical protein